jgi:hypothetical protein
MKNSTSIKAVFKCSLERAFKTPMLCDVTKVHAGYSLMPPVISSSEDENWGQPNGTRKILVTKSIFFKGGEAALDKVIERVENKYWKIEISNFKIWALGFTKFEGEWSTREITGNEIEIEYRYTLFSGNKMAYPFHWFVTKVIWRIYMKHVLENVRHLAYTNAPYLYQ